MREFFERFSHGYIVLFFSFFFIFFSGLAEAQTELDVITNNWLQYTDAQNSLYHHLALQACILLGKREKTVSGLKTQNDWQDYQRNIRKIFMDIVGPFPEKTPLNAKVIRIIEKEFCTIEHIVFESQPKFYVTSSLFIPKGLKKNVKTPAIIYCSGHSDDGYRNSVYQHVIFNLVKKGFIVFAFDPVGQGERLEYFDPKTGKSVIGIGTKEHSYAGAQTFLTGSSEARYMIWDGIRAVDYLLTRKEVDPARIGITGRSGGGTQSAYIAAFDDRIFAAAPENYLTNFTRLLESVGPQDAEQNLYHEIVSGIDLPDLLLVRAPKPALMITTTRDMFSIQGAMETEKEVAKCYKLFDKESSFGRVEDDDQHASTRKNREAMYRFFQENLNNPGNDVDEEVPILSKEEARVTPTGQVSTSYGSETVFTLNYLMAEKLSKDLQVLRDGKPDYFAALVSSVKKISGYHEPAEGTTPVFTGRIIREGYSIEKFFLRGEGEYPIPYLYFKPIEPGKKLLIYLNPSGKAADAAVGGNIEWFVKKGFNVISPDLIGTGEMGPGIFRGDAYIDNISHNIWYASMHVGRSITGIQAGDLIKLIISVLKTDDITEVYGLAIKEMGVVLLHAAAFEQSFSHIALLSPLSSYNQVATSHFYKSSFIPYSVPGSLKVYDLPDLAASLAPRKLLIVGPVDAIGTYTDNEKTEKDMTIIKSAYQIKKANDHLSIEVGDIQGKLTEFFLDWII